MLKSALAFSRRCALLLLLLAGAAGTAWSKGQGPVSVWPASERYVLVADKSYPGVVLVDLNTGAAVERVVIKKGMPKGIASCATCDFIFVSGSSGKFYLLRLKGELGELLESEGGLGLKDARIRRLRLST